MQSFPDTFQPDIVEAQAYKQFGNAVNVETVKIFAKYMFGDKKTLKKYAMPMNEIPTIDFEELMKGIPSDKWQIFVLT